MHKLTTISPLHVHFTGLTPKVRSSSKALCISSTDPHSQYLHQHFTITNFRDWTFFNTVVSYSQSGSITITLTVYVM